MARKQQELEGKILGCWVVGNSLGAILQDCGTTRIMYIVSCVNCGNDFEASTRNLNRRTKEPVNCEYCRDTPVNQQEPSKVCKGCDKVKPAKSFNKDTVSEKDFCYTCRNKMNGNGAYSGINAPKYAHKEVSCLRCGRKFKGGVNIRICGNCKSSTYFENEIIGVNFTGSVY